MSMAHIGSFSMTVTPGTNMVDVFKQNEIRKNPYSILNFSQMSLKKLAIVCPAGTKVRVNGEEITLVTGIFELGMGEMNITSLEFLEAVDVDGLYSF